MPRGGARPNSGPKPGPKIKLQQETIKLIGLTPGQTLDAIMNDKSQSTSIQIEAAKALMPYVHRKQPEALDLSGSLNIPGVVHFTSPLTRAKRADGD